MRIPIDDDCPGIPEADPVRVTDPFVLLDTSRNPTTGGVGLAACSVGDAVTFHGGSLILGNRAEGGRHGIVALLPEFDSYK